VIARGEVVEEHNAARPLPKVLLMAPVRGEPLYVSCAFDGRYAHIITVYWYDPGVSVDPWTRRKE
jgi:hypothetical protein